MNDTELAVRDRQLVLALHELAGRANPPDRVAAILARLDRARRRPLAGIRPMVAAVCLLGLGVTVAVATLRPPASPAAVVPATGPLAIVQDPPPKPAPPAPKPAPPAQEPGKPAQPDHPAGTSPADVAAKRSAEKMLAAERKLAARLREGKLPGVDQHLRFESLTAWKYTKGLDGMPPEVRALAGRKVSMVGFMLPIDEVKDIRSFLLVQSLWSCCYGTPPDVHGIVRVEMPKDRPIGYSFEPLLVTGTLRVQATLEDGYVVDIFQLRADTAVPLQ